MHPLDDWVDHVIVSSNDGVLLDLRPSDLQERGFNSCGRSDGHVKNSVLEHPTYFKLSLGHVNRSEKCPSNLRNMPIRPTKNSDLLKVPI